MADELAFAESVTPLYGFHVTGPTADDPEAPLTLTAFGPDRTLARVTVSVGWQVTFGPGGTQVAPIDPSGPRFIGDG